MGIVTEVADALEIVANAIENIRKITSAVSDSVDILHANHPEVVDDLAAMCAEMQKTLSAFAAASAVVTHFAFIVDGDLVDEAGKFQSLLVEHKARAEHVEAQLRAMRGRCHIIQEHADAIGTTAGRNFAGFLAAVGLARPEREAELAHALDEIYNEEMLLYRDVRNMTDAVQIALDAVREALGGPGTMHAANVPDAARVLGEHAVPFQKLESQANFLAGELQFSVDRLTRGQD